MARQATTTKAHAAGNHGWIGTGTVKTRFYGPMEPFFDKTWKPDDIVPVR